MTRRRPAIVRGALLVLCLGLAVQAGHAQTPAARDFIDGLNRARSVDNQPDLRPDAIVQADADYAAAVLARKRSVELDLEAQEVRLRRARYPVRRLASVAAIGPATPDRLLQQYLDEPDTRDLLLALDYSHIGVGTASLGSDRGGVWVITLAEPYAPAADGWRGEVLDLVNRFRARHDLPPLVANDTLDRIAQGHSDDMAARDFFDHDAPDGTTVGDRARAGGYRFRSISENIAAGMRRPARVVDGWIDSPPHREAMLDADVEEAGIGYAFHPFDDGQTRSVHYWTLNMGRR